VATQVHSVDISTSERIKELPEVKTFPFLIVPKASKSEKNKGLEDMPDSESRPDIVGKNRHPTVKPIKLMSYLITLGSRPSDTILDPFMGSGTTGLAAKLLYRNFTGIEIEGKYCEIAANRIVNWFG